MKPFLPPSAALDLLAVGRTAAMCALALFCLPHRVAGIEIIPTWKGGTGDWTDATKWTTETVPGNGAKVLIDNANADFNSVVTFNTSLSLAELNISTGDTLSLPDNRSLTLTGSSTIAGSLTLNSGGNSTNFIIGGASVTLNGGGTVTMGNHSSNRIYGSAGTETLVNQITIQGSGQLGVNLLSLINDTSGLVLANQSVPLVLDPNSSGVSNSGTLRATNGATLELKNGTFTNSSTGLIKADDDSHIDLSNATVSGGTLTSIDDGHFHIFGTSLFSNLDISSGTNIEVADNTTLQLSGTIDNAGTLKLLSGGNSTNLIASANTTLTGSGEIVLATHVNNRIYGASASTTLVNESNTISGYGQIGLDLLLLDNRSLVRANISGTTLALSPGVSTNSTLNSGTFQAVNGGIFRIENGTVVNTGGTIRADASSKVDLASAEISGGTLTTTDSGLIRSVSGSNTLSGSLTLSPGSQLQILDNTSLLLPASGTFTNNGTVTLSSGGNSTNLIIGGGITTLAGTGTIELGNHSNNRIYGGGGTDKLVLNSTGTIRGSGQIGVNLMGLVNDGTIKANQSTALIIDPSAAGVTNTGLLRADTGSRLVLQNGTFTNTNGEIEAFGTGAVVEFENATITNGELRSNAGAKFEHSSNSIFTDITLVAGSTFEVQDNTQARFTGTLTNQAAINLTSGGNSTDIIIDGGDLTLSGGGTITLGAHSNNRIYGDDAAYRLLNTDNLIQGSGQIGVNLMGLVNSATIKANQSTASLTINPSTAGVTNTGLLRADSSATLVLTDGTFTNTGGTIEAFDADARVDFNGATVVGGDLMSSGGGKLRNVGTSSYTDVTLTSGSIFEILDNRTAHFIHELNNLATVQLSSGGNSTNFIVNGNLALLGDGTIELGNHVNNRIYGAATTDVLTNVGNTIRGSGQIGVNLMGLDNQATITANQTTALTIDPSNAGVTNTGWLRAESGGTLVLQDGTFTNTNGIIEALGTGSKINFSGATVLNGSLISDADASLRHVSNSTFSGVSFDYDTTLDILDNTTATFTGTINNDGTINLQSAGNSTSLFIPKSGATFSGDGEIKLSNNSQNRIYGDADDTSVLTNHNWISGSGQLGLDQLQLVNHTDGVIEANQATPLTVNLSHAAESPFNNQGVLLATNGGNLVFVDALKNSGFVGVTATSTFTAQSTFTQTGGFVMLAGGTFTASSSTIGAESGIIGSGTIGGPVSNSGIIVPMNVGTFLENEFEEPEFETTGTLSFTGPLTLTASSLLYFELAGPTDYDRIQGQSIALNGTLSIGLVDGFESSILSSQTFTLLATTNANGLTGTFADIPNGARIFTYDHLGSFQINYLANAVTLSNFVPVPEPSTYALLGLGLIGIWWLRRRKVKHLIRD